jgi:hypothetical protein
MPGEAWNVVVTPAGACPGMVLAGAGVQDIRIKKISNILDSGLRRNDGSSRFLIFSALG